MTLPRITEEERMRGARWIVRSVEHAGDRPENQWSGIHFERAIAHAFKAQTRGAVSVWVEREGEVLWAAGEMAQELHDAGIRVLRSCERCGEPADHDARYCVRCGARLVVFGSISGNRGIRNAC